MEIEITISAQPFLFGRHRGIFSYVQGIRNIMKIPNNIVSLKSITLYRIHKLKELSLFIK